MYNKEFFNEKFVNYNEIEGNAWRMHWRASQIHRMEKALEYVEKATSNYVDSISISEIGCASADFTEKYYKAGLMHVVGVDLSDKAIEICKKKYKGDINLNFKQGDILNVDLSETYDLVICMDVLHYFSERDKIRALENIKLILNTEGKVILMIPLCSNNDAKEFIKIVKSIYKNIAYNYVYTEFYQKYFERWLLRIYDFLCSKEEWGGLIFAKWLKKILHSLTIFDFISRFDRKHIPSHIIIMADR